LTCGLLGSSFEIGTNLVFLLLVFRLPTPTDNRILLSSIAPKNLDTSEVFTFGVFLFFVRIQVRAVRSPNSQINGHNKSNKSGIWVSTIAVSKYLLFFVVETLSEV
jgi:hypothetical protein